MPLQVAQANTHPFAAGDKQAVLWTESLQLVTVSRLSTSYRTACRVPFVFWHLGGGFDVMGIDWSAPIPLQVARANIRPFAAGERQAPGWTESLHLVTVISGSGRIRIHGTNQEIGPGEALAVPWGQPVAYAAGAGQGMTLASVHLVPWAGDGVPPLPKDRWENSPERPVPAPAGMPEMPHGVMRPMNQPSIADLALSTIACWADRVQPDTWRVLRLRALATCYLTAFVAGPVGIGRIETLLRLLHRHSRNQISREDMCRLAGMSSTALNRAMRAATGQSPTAYLINLRLDEARRLLSGSNLSVAEVATQVGFNDRSHFSRLYTRRFGHAPQLERRNQA